MHLPIVIEWKNYIYLKGVFAKNERGYRLNAIKKALLIATYLTLLVSIQIQEDATYDFYRK